MELKLWHRPRFSVRTLVWLVFVGALALAIAADPAASPPQARPSCDLLLVGGKVMDGSGNPAFYGDVAVKDGRIMAVGKLKGKFDAAQTIDVRGKVVAPGFIDMNRVLYV